MTGWHMHLRRLSHDHDSKAAATHAVERRSSMETRKPACSWIDSPRRHTRSRASEMGRVDLPIMVVLFVQQQHEALARHNTAPNDLVSPTHLAEPLSAQANAADGTATGVAGISGAQMDLEDVVVTATALGTLWTRHEGAAGPEREAVAQDEDAKEVQRRSRRSTLARR